MNVFLLKPKLTMIKKKINLIREARHLRKKLSGNNYSFQELYHIARNSIIFRPTQKETEILRILELIQLLPVKTILEIGSYKGGNLVLFSQVAPKGSKILSLDIHYPIERRIAHSQLAKTGQRIICIKGDSKRVETLHKVRKILKSEEIDLLFIDGDHSLLGVMNDYVLYSPLVRKGGIIAFHDINPNLYMRIGKKTKSYVGEVPQFWSFLAKTGAKVEEFIEDSNQDGWGIGVIYKS